MTGFEPGSSDLGSDPSANCATTTKLLQRFSWTWQSKANFFSTVVAVWRNQRRRKMKLSGRKVNQTNLRVLAFDVFFFLALAFFLGSVCCHFVCLCFTFCGSHSFKWLMVCVITSLRGNFENEELFKQRFYKFCFSYFGCRLVPPVELVWKTPFLASPESGVGCIGIGLTDRL